jgi:hypothetical protein
MVKTVEELRLRAAQYVRRAEAASARAEASERKAETRRKIILGAAVMALDDASLIDRLVGQLSPRDRALFHN